MLVLGLRTLVLGIAGSCKELSPYCKSRKRAPRVQIASSVLCAVHCRSTMRGREAVGHSSFLRYPSSNPPIPNPNPYAQSFVLRTSFLIRPQVPADPIQGAVNGPA